MDTREETVSLWYELTAAAPSNLAADECSQEGLVGNGSHSVSFHESRSDFFLAAARFFLQLYDSWIEGNYMVLLFANRHETRTAISITEIAIIIDGSRNRSNHDASVISIF